MISNGETCNPVWFEIVSEIPQWGIIGPVTKSDETVVVELIPSPQPTVWSRLYYWFVIKPRVNVIYWRKKWRKSRQAKQTKGVSRSTR